MTNQPTSNQKKYIMIVVLVIMAIFNPSRSDFKSYLRLTNYSGIGRDFNGLVFSVYSQNMRYNRETTETIRGETTTIRVTNEFKDRYLGILGNFIRMSYRPEGTK